MLKKLVLATVGMALLLGAFAVPATADPTATVFDLNGIPGVKLDICSGGDEVVSNLIYGRAKGPAAVPAGTYKIKAKVAARGTCRGRLLAVSTVTFVAGQNYTLVYWQPFRRVQVKMFENDVSLPAADARTLSMRHTAKYPRRIDVWVWEHVKLAADEFAPTVANLKRGKASPPIAMAKGQFYVDVYGTSRTRQFGWEGFWGWTAPGIVTQLYLIGNREKNYRIAAIFQPGIAP